MKLIRFGPKGQEKPGILEDGIRKDCSAHFEDWDRRFFQANGLEELRILLRQEELPVVPQDARWGAPIARPGTLLCVGLNYSDHAKESGLEPPKEPVLFMKSTNTVSGPYDPVQIPRKSQKTDWEVELGIVLKRDALYLEDEAEAADCIAGYCVVNDLSEREFQLERSGQWVKGKSCPGFSPVGPWLSTANEVEDPNNLSLKLWVNEKLCQDGNTRTMIFSPTYIIWYVSQFMQLEAGDLISTGTPPGVGLGMKPPTYLKAEDYLLPFKKSEKNRSAKQA
ncbi:MAG: fumarylacetoacetate hydrolase family protein [Bacteroidota bacterium]